MITLVAIGMTNFVNGLQPGQIDAKMKRRGETDTRDKEVSKFD